MKTEETFERFVEVIRKLRDPNGGCPWDLEQTHQSLRPYLIEEAYEVLEAIDEHDDTELKSELGDVLLQVVLHAQVAKDRGAFAIEDVIHAVTEKMIRRHPHVFGDVKVDSADQVIRNWEKIKFDERKQQGTDAAKAESMLAGIPESMPALHRAQRLGEKAAKVSFDWSTLAGVWEKVNEELQELTAELSGVDTNSITRKAKVPAALRPALEHELGDLLFSLCQLARWLDLSAEEALRGCCKRFIERFSKMETLLNGPLSALSEDELENAWQKAKSALESKK